MISPCSPRIAGEVPSLLIIQIASPPFFFCPQLKGVKSWLNPVCSQYILVWSHLIPPTVFNLVLCPFCCFIKHLWLKLHFSWFLVLYPNYIHAIFQFSPIVLVKSPVVLLIPSVFPTQTSISSGNLCFPVKPPFFPSEISLARLKTC